MGNVQAHQIKLHQSHSKLIQDLQEYHQFKNEYHSKYGYYTIICPYCALTAHYHYGNYYCDTCGDYAYYYQDYDYWYSQSNIIWMFGKRNK